MASTLIAFALLPSLAAAQAQPPAKPCKPLPQVARGHEPMRARPLNEMPPAKQIIAVYRERNGCSDLAVVREQVGAPARR